MPAAPGQDVRDGGPGGPGLMAVYVDDMWRVPLGRYGRMKMSHMMADTSTRGGVAIIHVRG